MTHMYKHNIQNSLMEVEKRAYEKDSSICMLWKTKHIHTKWNNSKINDKWLKEEGIKEVLAKYFSRALFFLSFVFELTEKVT